MQIINAEISSLFIDEYGNGELTFRWPDAISGYEELNIELDGFCSRRMPIHSGRGIVALERQRDYLKLRFTPELALKLELTEEVEFRFVIADAQYDVLRSVTDAIQGKYD